MPAAEKQQLSEAEYLARERLADTKHEYVNGVAVAMAGGSPRHNVIATNIAGELRARLRGQPCRPTNSDQRVHVAHTGLYTYPDVTVICGQPETHPEDRNTLCNPRVIFEVLSTSTEAYDRGAKFRHYRRSESLAEYVLVSQHERLVEHFRRGVAHQQMRSASRRASEEILAAAGSLLHLDEIYL
ncbi:MAG: Uma2 family endonuclease, partial [Myxococcales bacterium]|nr:Uma2 family endonuclease [Myxococcales bacterium]